MSSFDAYEHNLHTRLSELRRGDQAYELHGNAILETLPYAAAEGPDYDIQRILDVGCGLGFLALKLAHAPNVEVVGIDPSAQAIAIAEREHVRDNLRFYTASAEGFPAMMKRLNVPLFERAILNMVLHSVDDETCSAILNGVRQSLPSLTGILTCIVPGQAWLAQKLVEKAQAEGMNREDGIAWVTNQMDKDVIDLTVNIAGQPAYEEPITIYNRNLSHYAKLLRESGYGLEIKVRDPVTGKPRQTMSVPYWEWSDHTSGYELSTRDRHILMTQVA